MQQQLTLIPLFLLLAVVTMSAQNVGINEDDPTNALHIRSVVPNADPLRVEGLQTALAADQSILVCEPAAGVVRLASIGSLFTDTDDQTLSFNTSTFVLTISEGNSVDLSDIDTDTDDQTLTFNATNGDLTISEGNTVNIAGVDTDDQTLSFDATNGNLTIVDGNTVDISGVDTDTDDQTLSISGQTLSIADGNSVTLPNNNTDDQTLSFNTTNNQLTIEAGNTVDLSDIDTDTDDQTLSYNGATNTLTISEGNSVNLDDLDTNDNLGNHSATQELDMNNNDIRENRYLRFNASEGNGIRFWNSASYSITMGNSAEYQYGPVTDYSIRNTMNNSATRGWTWGVAGATPGAALSTGGTLQLAGDHYVMGDVGIGIDNPSVELHVVGNIFATGNASDRRFKRNVRPYAGSMLDLVDRLRTVDYEYRTEEFPKEAFPSTTQTGFIAQELEQLVPNAVFDRADGYKGVDYGKVTPVLVAALQELRREVEQLKTERDELRAEVTRYEAMEARLTRLEALLDPPTNDSTDTVPVNTEK